MKGFLFVEEDLLGKPNGTFTRRYFVTFPFCGLKWFKHRSRNSNLFKLLGDKENCGWVFGGSIIPSEICIERTVKWEGKVLFPFSIIIKSGEHTLDVKVAVDNEISRQKWVDELSLMIKNLHYVNACFENDTLAYPFVISEIFRGNDEYLSIRNIQLSNRVLSSLISYFNFSSPQGLVLQTLKLEAVHLGDNQVHLINSIFALSPYLNSVSLAENFLTSKGIRLFCEGLSKCKHISEINLSNNRIDDSSTEVLVKTLATISNLKKLNIAHNKLTHLSVKPLILKLATHGSKLTHVDFSYNDLGDGIGAFFSLLLYNQPSILEFFDISFCGIQDHGIYEFAQAISSCSSLQNINMHGCNMDSNSTSLQYLMDQVSVHHSKYYKNHQRLVVSLGGIMQDCDGMDCIPFKVLKISMPYVSNFTNVSRLILRRHLQYIINPPSLKAMSIQQQLNKSNNKIVTINDTKGNPILHPIICMRIKFVDFITHPEEFLSYLAQYLQIDIIQLRLLSCSPMNEDRLYFVIFTIEDILPARYFYQQRCTWKNAYGLITESKHHHDTTINQDLRNMMLTTIESYSSRDILMKIESMSRSSHPLLRKLGVISVLMHFPSNYIPGFVVDTNNSHTTTKRKQSLKTANEIVSINFLIQGARDGGRGFEDHYIPPLSPKDMSQYEGYRAPEDTDDDEFVDKSLRHKEKIVRRSRSATRQHIDVSEDDDEEDEELSTTQHDETETRSTGEYSFITDQEEDDEARTTTNKEHSVAEHQQQEETDSVVDGTAHESYAEKIAAKNNLRATNERLIFAVRELYAEHEVTSQVAKFWEGAFGNRRHKDVTKKVMDYAIEPETGIFHGIHIRQQLCEAMFQRDLPQLTLLLNQVRERGTIEGGTMFIYAQRLLSEIIGLQKRFEDVSIMTNSYENLSVVEDFLLSCAKLGYSGPEMFDAVTLRQTLAEQGVNEGTRNTEHDLYLIRHKALYTNLMISREMEPLERKIEELKYSSEDSLFLLPETIAAQKLLSDQNNTLQLLRDAIALKDIEALDNALAVAAYHYCYFPEVAQAIEVLSKISKNPSMLLLPIVQGLRESDMSKIEKGFEFVHKMGWHHPALDAVVCSKIHAKKSKIIQDDSVKSRVIKLCLALKNGFKTKPSEIMQLIRRAHAIKLDQDPEMKQYFQIISKQMKKFAGIVKQEKEIQVMIDNDDIDALSRLLSGRGNGRLIMSAPSAHTLEEWYSHLEACCQGVFHDNIMQQHEELGEEEVDSHEVFFTGTLEKAARSDDGKVRGWRKRYFVLESIMMTYYTRAHKGEKKGSIRVLGGGVRRMDPSEVGGRKYCLELEEGRDISSINPDLLDEARKQVRLKKIHEIETSLRRGIRTKDLELLSEMIQFAADLEIMLDFELMNEAKTIIATLRMKKLKLDMRLAAILATKSKVQQLVEEAEKYKLDPNIPSYHRVREISMKPDIEQTLLSIRGALVLQNKILFYKNFKSLNRYDLTTLTTKQRHMLASMMIQYSGLMAHKKMIEGFPDLNNVRIMRLGLNCCSQLVVETEAMDTMRLLINLVTRNMGDTMASNALGGKITETDSSVASYLEHMKEQTKMIDMLYDINKFPRLRLYTSQINKGLGIASSLGIKQKYVDIMNHTTTVIIKSLLKYETPILDPALCIEAFQVLLVIMGDKAISSLSRPKKNNTGILRTKATDTSIVLDIIDAAAVRFPQMRDEIYFHICKQLNKNPSNSGRAKGWMLFSVYLHSFPPSSEAIPYIINFVAVSMDDIQQGMKMLEADEDAHDEDRSRGRFFNQIMTYCLKLLMIIEATNQHSVDVRTTTAAAAQSTSTVTSLTSNIISQIFEVAPVEFEVIIMTGSVYKFQLPYGQISTPYSILTQLYERLLPEEINENQIPQDVDDYENYMYRMQKINITRDNKIKSLFMGYGLYMINNSDYSKNSHTGEKEVDLNLVPVQPPQSGMIDWTYDLQWDMIIHNPTAAEEEGDDEHQSERNSVSFEGSKFVNRFHTLVLRRHTGMASEAFADDHELFNDQISSQDVSALQDIWSKWLSSPTQQPLPKDHLRIDFQYAEDTRCVNSRLYPISDACFHYLLAMQVALCWVEDDAEEWGEGHDTIIGHVNFSIRPCYKFFPRHRQGANVDDIDVDDENIDDEEYVRQSIAARRSTTGGAGRMNRGSIANNKRGSVANSSNKRGSAVNNLAQLDKEASDSSSSSDEELEESNTSSDDDDDAEETESSEYVSSEEDDTDDEKEERRKLQPIISMGDMTEYEHEHLSSIIEGLGVNVEAVSMELLISWVVKFHALVIENKITINSYKYRYLMKRSYIQYLMGACPLYGSQFYNATMLSTHRTRSNSQTDASLDKVAHKTTKMAVFEPDALTDLDSNEVLVAVSSRGIMLLNDDWDVIFQAPMWDIQECSLKNVSAAPENNRKSKRMDNNVKKYDIVSLNVNGLSLHLSGDNIHDIFKAIDTCCHDMIGRGHFPYGRECDEFGELPISNSALNAMSNSNSVSDMSLYDTKYCMTRYLQKYPMLPRPPVGDMLKLADKSFVAPPSRRALLAQERAEEERIELEMIRLASEAQMERTQKQVKQGRENMMKYQGDRSNNAGDEEDDGSGDEGENRGGNKKEKQVKNKRESQRRNRSLFGGITNQKTREEILQERVNAAICGVSERMTTSTNSRQTTNSYNNSNNIRIADIKIPIIPSKVNGQIKMDMTEKKRLLTKPILEESRGAEAFFDDFRPVGLNINFKLGSGVNNNNNNNIDNTSSNNKKSKHDPKNKAKEMIEHNLEEYLHNQNTKILEHYTTKFDRYLTYSQNQHQLQLQGLAAIDDNTMSAMIAQKTAEQQQSQQEQEEEFVEEVVIDENGDEMVVEVPVAKKKIKQYKDAYLYGIDHYLRKRKVKKPKSNNEVQ